MEDINYKAFVVREDEKGQFSRQIENKSTKDLPDHDVIVKVHYAALNYKDALSASGHKGISKTYPHVPGVDACGEVVSCKTDQFQKGDLVIVTSYDFGMNTSGGFQEYISVPDTWPVLLPEKMSLEEAMIIGTGGFTAALALYKMEQNGQHPSMGPILVTGSTGGVGSMAVNILSINGYEVMAATGKKEQHPFLKSLGAHSIVSREEVNDTSGRPLLRSKWAGAIDTVGDNTLATCIKACGRNGSIAVCGLVQSPELQTTVYPFILNGVNVLGIETAETPRNIRIELWRRLAQEWKPSCLEEVKDIIDLSELEGRIQNMLRGKSLGRTVVKFV